MFGLASLLIGGCSAVPAKMKSQVEFAANNMKGFPVAKLKECAGLPHSINQSKNYEVYRYRAEASGVMGNYGYCEMLFYVSNGEVKEVFYKGENPTGILTGTEFCGPIISQCLVRYFGQQDPGNMDIIKFNKIEDM